MPRSNSFFWRTFTHPANLLWVMAAGAHSAVTGDPTTVALAAGVEGVYLLGSKIMDGRKRSKPVSSGADERLAAAMAELSPSQRQQAESLVALRGSILANYRKLPGGKVLAASSEARLDSLLSSFVRLIGSLNSYRAHLGNASRRSIEDELADLREGLDDLQNPRLREVKVKRVEILEKRLQRFIQAEESREVVSHQLAAIEDLLRLTLEQSISIRDPSSAVAQLDALSAGVESSEETVREMERIMEIGGEELFLSSGALERDRVR